ncbi:hypothetical protein EZV62_022981 [Acer yangbiense]|uniref:KIB1-4 beta-propeller domain-containing protein n=1 Tax=Acer yangbiense TaxID=1000413 RepID=A0A5C7H0V7_9ROSI|nr:hypothetical protein EZV62_022981 [Acer yangbiense]
MQFGFKLFVKQDVEAEHVPVPTVQNQEVKTMVVIHMIDKKDDEAEQKTPVMLFLGYNSSVSIEASNFYKPNCIYFTDDCMGSYWEDKRGGGKDMGIYNLHDGSITSVPFKGDPYSHVNPAMWVEQSGV